MISDRGDGIVYPSFSTAEIAAREGEAVLRALQVYDRMLGASALSGSSKVTLMPIADELRAATERVQTRIENIEEKELFGGDESYWNVFRYFCIEDNRGLLRSVEQVWDHLALTFDMSQETLGSISEALASWKNDIEEDAKQKYKATGVFDEIGVGFVFYEHPESIERRLARQKRTEKRAVSISTIESKESTSTDESRQSVETPSEGIG